MAYSLQVPVLSIRSFSGLRASNSSDNMIGFGQGFRSKVAMPIRISSKQGTGSRCVPKASLFQHFTDKSIDVITLAQDESRRLGHNYVGTEQILLGLLAEGTGIAAKVLENMGINLKVTRLQVEKIIGGGDASGVEEEIPFTPHAKCVLELSKDEARRFGRNSIGSGHLLLGLLRAGGVAGQVLENLGADPSYIRTEVIHMIDEGNEVSVETGESNGNKKMPTHEEYGTNLSKLAEEGKLDLFVGRKDEIEHVVQILSRRTKNNPCLVGKEDDRVDKSIIGGLCIGKTIVEGLAQRIANGDVPDKMKGKKVIKLDMCRLYRGGFEEILKKLRDEIKQSDERIILFIDEEHTVVNKEAGPAEGAIDAANILKPALASDELQCIVATTFDEYKEHIEKDPALERFVPVQVTSLSSVDKAFHNVKASLFRFLEEAREGSKEFWQVTKSKNKAVRSKNIEEVQAFTKGLMNLIEVMKGKEMVVPEGVIDVIIYTVSLSTGIPVEILSTQKI